MRKFFMGLLHRRKTLDDAVQAALNDTRPAAEHPMGKRERPVDPISVRLDPLESRGRQLPALFGEGGVAASVNDFPVVSDTVGSVNGARIVGDSKVYTADSMISGTGGPAVGKGGWAAYGVPEALMSWYASHSFIGYQSCAIIAQHWLVDKACTMPGEDAVRNGYQVTVASDASDQTMDPDTANEYVAKLQDLDNDYNIADELVQFWRFTQIYGIRVAVYDVQSEDPEYYSKPFNIDGVTKDSYKGIRQIDPYWMMPVLANGETSDPTNPHFYDPSFWIIAGKKFHRSHLVIGRGPEPADILKPTYQFGGIPLSQRIYERVYAAERTANEGPLLAMTKRTTVLKTNLASAELNPQRFRNRLLAWAELRDNFGVKTVNTEDAVEQHDTALADLDLTIMTQYQLVAAIAKVPATKLLGTSPKGFNATGENETKSYHEHLEAVQKFLSPFLTRHHELLARSKWGVDLPIKHTWNRVDSFTAKELAELNLIKAQTGEILVTTVAAISSDEERNRLKNDSLSGYGHLGDVEAETEIGVTPETEQGAMEAEAKAVTAEAKVEESDPNAMVTNESATSPMETLKELRSFIMQANGQMDDRAVVAELEAVVSGLTSADPIAQILPIVEEIVFILKKAKGAGARSAIPSVRPGVTSESGEKAQGIRRIGDGNQAGLPEGGAGRTHRSFRREGIADYTVVVETPAGQIRAGRDGSELPWAVIMPYDYGYIEGSTGADGEEVDVFLGPNRSSDKIYIINQVQSGTNKFDEHKVMMGFDSQREAVRAYQSAYTKGWRGFASCWEVTPTRFREWLREDDLTRPFHDLWHD